MIEARGVSGGLFFLPTDEEEVGKEIAVHAAIVMLATYTSLIGAERVDNSVLESFVDKADVYAAATEKTPFMDEHLSATKLLLYMLEQGLPRQEIFRRAQQILNEAGESAD